jgi:hypothetical protein
MSASRYVRVSDLILSERIVKKPDSRSTNNSKLKLNYARGVEDGWGRLAALCHMLGIRGRGPENDVLAFQCERLVIINN